MDGMRYGEVTAISRYWTPQHRDVTDEPLPYAAPKPSWLDNIARHGALAPIDARDRALRRRMNTHAVVEPNEIVVLPHIVPAAAQPSPLHNRVLAGARLATAALSGRRIAH